MSIPAVLQLEETQAACLHDALCGGIDAATLAGGNASLLLQMSGRLYSYYGFGTFPAIRGRTHDPSRQAKHTILLFRGEKGHLSTLRNELPGFNAACTFAEIHCPGLSIARAHVMLQSSVQACLDWHTDTATRGYAKVRRTVVIQLSDTQSTIDVRDADGRQRTLKYKKRGSAVLIDSTTMHRSGLARRGTIKLTLMLAPTSRNNNGLEKKISGPRSRRGLRASRQSGELAGKRMPRKASAGTVQAGNTVFVIDPEYEVPDFALPRCADLRELVDKVCQMPDKYNFRSDERGRDRFRAVVMSAGEGKPETVVSLQKPVTGVCEPDKLEFRFDEKGKGRPMEQLDERLETPWAAFLHVPLVVETGPGSDGTFFAGKEDEGFSVRLQLHMDDYNNVWSFEVKHLSDESDSEEDKGPPYSRPRGRPPLGKAWDEQTGSWVDEESGNGTGRKSTEKRPRKEQDVEKSSDTFVAAMLTALTTVETRIVTLVYACADRKTDVYISRDQLMRGLTALRISRPTEKLEQARIKLLSTLTHNGCSGASAGIALTPEGIQMAIGAINFELGSIDRAVGVLKSACESGELGDVANGAQDESAKKRKRDAPTSQKGQNESPDPRTPPARPPSLGSGGSSVLHTNEVDPALASAVEAAAEGVLGSVTELETSLNKMLLSFPQQVEASDLQYEIGHEGHRFFMEKERFPTPDETQELVKTVKRMYLSKYQIGNVTRSTVEGVIALLGTARNGATEALTLAKNYDAREVD